MGLLSLLRRKECSSSLAKDRLKLVLLHDRTSISPKVIEEIRKDIIISISKYVDIDVDKLDIQMTEIDEKSRKAALIANIPIKN